MPLSGLAPQPLQEAQGSASSPVNGDELLGWGGRAGVLAGTWGRGWGECWVKAQLSRRLGAFTPTCFHGLLSNLRLFLAFRFGDHHGCEGSDKAVVERQAQSSGLEGWLLGI